MCSLTFENHCLEDELTFGDPFQDSGVVRGFGSLGLGLRVYGVYGLRAEVLYGPGPFRMQGSRRGQPVSVNRITTHLNLLHIISFTSDIVACV
jgi:hypothetical protein